MMWLDMTMEQSSSYDRYLSKKLNSKGILIISYFISKKNLN